MSNSADSDEMLRLWVQVHKGLDIIPVGMCTRFRYSWASCEGSCDTSNSYTMDCPPVRGDNSRALASGLSYVQVDKHNLTILYHLHVHQ